MAKKSAKTAPQSASNTEKGGGSDKFAKALKLGGDSFAAAREKAAEHKGGGGDPEPGTYVTRLQPLAVNSTGKDKNNQPYVILSWKVIDGDHTGQRITKFYKLNDDGLSFIMDDLGRLGVDTDGINDSKSLLAAIEEITNSKPVVKLKVKEKNDYLNVYIDKVLDDDGEYGDGESETKSKGKKGAKPAKGKAKDAEEEEDDSEDAEEEEEDADDSEEEEEEEEEEEDAEEDADDSEEEEEEEEEEAIEVEVGDEISFKVGKKKHTGTIAKLNKDGTLKVKVGKDYHTVSSDQMV